MNNISATVNPRELLLMFAELDSKNQKKAHKAALINASRLLVNEAKRNFKSVVKKPNSKNRWNGRPMNSGIKYSIDKNSEIAKNLKGRLLLFTGDIDNNVHPGNTLRMVNALIRANKRFDMMMLPGQRHGFGDMTEYFFWRMGDYFSRYLIGDYKNEVEIPEMNNN